MQRRLGALFAIVVLLSTALAGCRAPSASQEDDKQAAINVVLAHELNVQKFDFDTVDSLHTPDARVIDDSYPHAFEPDEREGWKQYQEAGIHVEYHPRDAVAEVRGNVAWVTLALPSVFTSDAPVGQAMLGASEWRVTFVETFILVKTQAGWKIAFRHTSTLFPVFGVEPDFRQPHGGMKFLTVTAGGSAATAGFQPGDVLIDYGGHKIETPVDFERYSDTYAEGEKINVTVLRGSAKITKEITFQAP